MRPITLGSVLALCLLGCQPQVGDPCVTSVDCSQQGDRLCDTSQPEGYCTVFDCQPDKCPGDSICIRFGSELDPACPDDGPIDSRWPRFERSFCLATCEVDDDCRDGYACIAPGERRGEPIDLESELRGSKACFRATEPSSAADGDVPSVCDPGGASEP